MFRKMQIDFVAAGFKFLRLILAVAIWSCHALIAPAVRLCQGWTAELHPQEGALEPKFSNPNPGSPNKFEMPEKAEMNRHVMVNPESVMPNLFRHLFRAGLFQHPASFLSAFSRHTFHPRSQDEVFRKDPSKPQPPRPLNPSGFTLIELIVTMVIIGILAATLLPRIDFGSMSSQTSVAAAADMVASDIRYAQEWAMANRTSKTITFNGSSTYTFNPASTGMDPSGQLPSVKGVPAVTASAVTFTFNSLGEPTTGGGSSVTVSGGGVSIPITVNAYTGKISYLSY